MASVFHIIPIRSHNARVSAMKLDLLIKQSHIAFIANIVNPTIFFALAWKWLSFHLWIGAWYAAMLALTFVRWRIGRRWELEKSQLPPEKAEVLAWKRRFDIGTFLSGTLWGMIAFSLMPESPPQLLLLVAVLIAGMTAAGIGTYSPSKITTCLFVIPCATPLFFRLLAFDGAVYAGVCAMIALYLILMLIAANNLAGHVEARLALMLEKDQLLSEKQNFEAASKAKSMFLANVSHEIRTPIAAINGFVELLLRNPHQTKQMHNDLLTVSRNGTHLVAVINDLLDLARIENGQVLIEKCWVSPRELIADAVKSIEVRAKEKNLQIEAFHADNVPDKIFTDPNRFAQIVLNLLTNALKFTNEGKISVWTQMHGRDEFSVQVTDSGIGIEPSLAGKIFEPFVRGRSDDVKREQGSGLGLALSQTLARCLGGDLKLAQSVPGHGSTFELKIQAEYHGEIDHSAPRRKDADAPVQRLSGKTILVVDDDPDLRELMQRYLTDAGVQTVVCANGLSAIHTALSQKFDAILMDIQMPKMDGYAASQKLRNAGYAQPLIAITAHASLEDQQKCLDSGCDGYLSKPFQRDRFLQTIAKHVS